jgi:hypothetical protein
MFLSLKQATPLDPEIETSEQWMDVSAGSLSRAAIALRQAAAAPFKVCVHFACLCSTLCYTY